MRTKIVQSSDLYGDVDHPIGVQNHQKEISYHHCKWPNGPPGTLRVSHGTKNFSPKIIYYQPHMVCIYVIFRFINKKSEFI